jgi:hypothetical protein
MSLAAPASHAALVAHYAAVRARLDPRQGPPARHGSAWQLDDGADDAARIRVCAAVLAVVAAEQGGPPTISQVKRVVCRVFGTTREDIDSPSRGPRLVAARHVAMTLARRLSGHSLPEIGRRFGGRDHSTVRHAVGKWRAAVARAIVGDAKILSRSVSPPRDPV